MRDPYLPRLTVEPLRNEIAQLLSKFPEVEKPPLYEYSKVPYSIIGKYVMVSIAYPITEEFIPGLHFSINSSLGRRLRSLDNSPYCFQLLTSYESDGEGGVPWTELWLTEGMKVEVIGKNHSVVHEVVNTDGHPGFISKDFTPQEWPIFRFRLLP